MTSDNDKKAAEETLSKYWGETDGRAYDEDYKNIFLKGCEHKQKELEQIKEQVAREAYYDGCDMCEPQKGGGKIILDFKVYWQQKNKGEG